jgi:hypothetical protein
MIAAADAFKANPNLQNAYNKLQVTQGTIDPKHAEWGVLTLGTFREIPLTVDETTYENASGVLTPYVPPKQILIACSAAAENMSYAGVVQANNEESALEVYEGRRVPCISIEKMEDYRKLRVSSRPVPVPRDLSSWTVLTVLA